jgi:hypothetical protein
MKGKTDFPIGKHFEKADFMLALLKYFDTFAEKKTEMWTVTIEILDLEQVCWHRSCKYILGKEHLVKIG